MQKRVYNLDIQRIENPTYKYFKIMDELPTSVNLRSLCAPIYNQGTFESSAVNAFVSAFNFDNNGFIGSRLFLYYNDKMTDKQSSMHSCACALYTHGLCSEQIWPYAQEKQNTLPPISAYENAKFNQISKYDPMNVIYDLQNIKMCLVSKIPICVGICVYDSFDKNKTGHIKMPNLTSEKLLGGHAIMLVGYNDQLQTFIFANSFGQGWGQNGFGTIPYEYIMNENMTTDLWIFKRSIAKRQKKVIEKKKFKSIKKMLPIVEMDVVEQNQPLQISNLKFGGKSRHLMYHLIPQNKT